MQLHGRKVVDVKFIITKTVEVEEVADEIMGNEASFFMLRT